MKYLTKGKQSMKNNFYKKIINKIIKINQNNQSFIDYMIENNIEILTKKNDQKLYEQLLNIALAGMNYGNGGSVYASGEIHAINYIKSKTSKSDIVLFDVGANIGLYSQELLKLFNDTTFQIHCFEPSKKIFEILNENLNNINIVKNNVGIGNVNTKHQLFFDENNSLISSVYKRKLDHFNMNMNSSEIIQIITIDDYCENHNIKKVDFLKLDIEGNELNALIGAKDMISSGKIRFIQFEFGGCNIDSRTYFQDFYYLLKNQYNLFRITKEELYPINSYKESLEIFSTINFLAELKQ